MLSAIAPAKLNLSLHVTGRRADGYHLLDSLVVFTRFGDLVNVAPADVLRLQVSGEFGDDIPVDHHNLVLRAAQRLREHYVVSQGANISLTKLIPIGAGLGGGSSDAATAALLLNRLWQIDAPIDALCAVLAPLGADISACLHAPQAVWMRGIGDIVSDAPAIPAWQVLLVNPRVELLTADVYRTLRLPDQEPLAFEGDIARYVKDSRNDLEVAAETLCPAVREVLAALREDKDAFAVRVCGSGATCFALYETEEAARRAASVMRDHGWWVCETLIAQAEF